MLCDCSKQNVTVFNICDAAQFATPTTDSRQVVKELWQKAASPSCHPSRPRIDSSDLDPNLVLGPTWVNPFWMASRSVQPFLQGTCVQLLACRFTSSFVYIVLAGICNDFDASFLLASCSIDHASLKSLTCPSTAAIIKDNCLKTVPSLNQLPLLRAHCWNFFEIGLILEQNDLCHRYLARRFIPTLSRPSVTGHRSSSRSQFRRKRKKC